MRPTRIEAVFVERLACQHRATACSVDIKIDVIPEVKTS